jgi:hypothetical protein
MVFSTRFGWMAASQQQAAEGLVAQNKNGFWAATDF